MRAQSEARKNQHLPSPEPNIASPPIAGAFRGPPTEEKQTIPEITPMRRGRPVKAEVDPKVPKPSPSPLRSASNDPWAALDSAPSTSDAVPSDDASIRFPPLDDFSLLHDSGSNFAFDPNSAPKKQPSQDISQRVANALADDAFALAKTQSQTSSSNQHIDAKAKANPNNGSKPVSIPNIATQQPATQRPSMVSTGTMTSPSPPSPTLRTVASNSRPIFRFPSPPSSPRSSSQPRASDLSEQSANSLRADALGQRRPGMLEHRSKSQILTLDSSQSSQPSLEKGFRSTYLGGVDGSIQRSKSASSKARPASVQNPTKPNILRRMSRERPESRSKEELSHESFLTSAPTGDVDDSEEAVQIDSNVDFLKAIEEEEASKRKEKRLSSGSRHIKRASMPSVSLSGTKSLLAGRFGDAFKRFEANTSGSEHRDSSRSPVRGPNDLTPIAGSEATDGRSDDGNDLEESQEIPPEMRRELERRRLSQEEKRVADAAAAYRQRLAEGGEPGRGRPGDGRLNNKAASIQSKVQSLLDENGRASPSPTKTAFGYSRSTEPPDQQRLPPRTSSRQIPSNPPFNNASSQLASRRKPVPDISPASNRPGTSSANQPPLPGVLPRHSAPPSEHPFTHPTAPPKPLTKPQNLRTGERPPQSPAKPASLVSKKLLPPRLQQQQQQQQQPSPDNQADGASDDWEANFSKRYPDLAGLEMVETEIDSGTLGANTPPLREMRIRDV